MYTVVNKCRICGNINLKPLLSLGNQAFTGIFPCSKKQAVPRGPLELVKCWDKEIGDCCGLVQLRHNFDMDVLYGDKYGYRSSLNISMVEHLNELIQKINRFVSLKKNDLIIDIGSNDGTLLKAYPEEKLILVGIDPIGKKFQEFYPNNIRLLPDFFSADLVKMNFSDKKAKVITSIAMFYDLPNPVDFVRQIHEILANDGIWLMEQSYMPKMLDMNSYDMICHEHLEYYTLKQIKFIFDRVGFKIIDVEFNDINGGSIAVMAAKEKSSHAEAKNIVSEILTNEIKKGLDTLDLFYDFKKSAFKHRDKNRKLIKKIKDEGKTIIGYGASTKGNVFLQFCGITPEDVTCIAEVNENKFECYTPGTYIPIVPEERARAKKPDYFMVLPWHFKKMIINKEQDFLKSGGHLYFPFPEPEII